MRNFLSRRSLTVGLIGVPAAALAPPAVAQLEPIDPDRYLAFLQAELRRVLVERQAIKYPCDLRDNWMDTPFLWLPEGFEHPEGPAMDRARAVLAAAKALP